jgi:hypothetical protein
MKVKNRKNALSISGVDPLSGGCISRRSAILAFGENVKKIKTK